MKEIYIQPAVEEKERPETRVEKLFGNLEEQYLDQVRVLNDSGLIEVLPESEDLGFYDINGEERVIPRYEDLVELMGSKIEIIERKYRQGFTELQLTPLGASMRTILHALKVLIQEKSVKGTFFDAQTQDSSDRPELHFDVEKPVYISVKELETDSLLYYPDNFDMDSDSGVTKGDSLQMNQKFSGWNIVLVESQPTLLGSGEGEMVSGRHQLESGLTGVEYLEKIQFHDGYQDEVFFTPEDWIVYFMSNLKLNNTIIEASRGNGKICFLLASRSPGTPYTVGAQFNSHNRIQLSSMETTISGPQGSTRTVVKLN